jgi:hypothetical protein
VTPLRMRLLSAFVTAFVILSLFASVAAADEGGSDINVVPFDPGLGEQVPPPPPWPFTE